MLDDILARVGPRASAAEAFEMESDETVLRIEAGSVEQCSPPAGKAAAIRVMAGGRTGFAAAGAASGAAELVERGLEACEEGETAGWIFPSRQAAYPHPRVSDPVLQAMSLEELAAMGQQGLAMLKRVEPAGKYSAEIRRVCRKVAVANTRGLRGQYEKTLLFVTYRAEVGIGEESLRMRVANASCRGSNPNHGLTGIVAERLDWGRGIIPMPAGRMPVVFTWRALPRLTRVLQNALNGDGARNPAQPFMGKLGSQLFDPQVSVMDDPLADWAPGSAPFDGEGAACRRTVLVDRGKLSGYFLDTRTAHLAGKQTTANAGRGSGLDKPAPSMHNVDFRPANTPFERLVNDIGFGLLVDEVSPGEPVCDEAGHFSLRVELGFRIDAGRVMGRVSGAVVSGNLFELLHAVRGVSRTRRWAENGFYPDLSLDSVMVDVL